MGRRATDPGFHVAGIVVYAVPAELGRVADSIAALPEARVHASSAEGKLVVTLEAADAATVIAAIDDVRKLPGVAGAALIYQHGEDDIEDAHEHLA